MRLPAVLTCSFVWKRAGAVGINLTQANRVFLMEPGFNPALEQQAIGRVWRLGQKRNVEICRLIIKESFESRMVEFLKKKYKLAFDDDEPSADKETNPDEGDQADGQGAGDGNSQNKKKKKGKAKDSDVAQALIGNLQTEKAQVVTEEFDELFGVLDKVNQSSSQQDEPQMDDDGNDIVPDGATSSDI